MYIATALFAVFNGRQLPTELYRKMHVAAQGRERETFRVSKESSAVCA